MGIFHSKLLVYQRATNLYIYIYLQLKQLSHLWGTYTEYSGTKYQIGTGWYLLIASPAPLPTGRNLSDDSWVSYEHPVVQLPCRVDIRMVVVCTLFPSLDLPAGFFLGDLQSSGTKSHKWCLFCIPVVEWNLKPQSM